MYCVLQMQTVSVVTMMAVWLAAAAAAAVRAGGDVRAGAVQRVHVGELRGGQRDGVCAGLGLETRREAQRQRVCAAAEQFKLGERAEVELVPRVIIAAQLGKK